MPSLTLPGRYATIVPSLAPCPSKKVLARRPMTLRCSKTFSTSTAQSAASSLAVLVVPFLFILLSPLPRRLVGSDSSNVKSMAIAATSSAFFALARRSSSKAVPSASILNTHPSFIIKSRLSFVSFSSTSSGTSCVSCTTVSSSTKALRTVDKSSAVRRQFSHTRFPSLGYPLPRLFKPSISMSCLRESSSLSPWSPIWFSRTPSPPITLL
mmetsp:Transcript_22931/g.33516  ORF Transcript_22931/g.33516 Transcript_22931/m.33516 type:complete len:211 (+) Transcript_22931:745-1377(+)